MYNDNDAWNVTVANAPGVAQRLNLARDAKHIDKGVEYITYEELKNRGANDATLNQFNKNDIIRLSKGDWNVENQEHEINASPIGNKEELRQTWLYDMGLTGAQMAKINKNTTNW